MQKADPVVLRLSPESVTIENNTLVLDAYVYRDFMPISPHDGKPMICVGILKDADSSELVNGITPIQQHVIYEDQVWSSQSSEIYQYNEFSIEYVTRNGPKWGPGVLVDVVLEFKYQNKLFSIQTKHQNVNRTD